MYNLKWWEITALSLICALYFLPIIIAFLRGHKNRASIFILNLFLGWTALGWIGSLIWAVMKKNN